MVSGMLVVRVRLKLSIAVYISFFIDIAFIPDFVLNDLKNESTISLKSFI